METLFKNTKIDLHVIGPGKYAVVLTNSPKLAKRLNDYLDYYPKSTTFGVMDEIRLIFNAAKLPYVVARLKVNSLSIQEHLG